MIKHLLTFLLLFTVLAAVSQRKTAQPKKATGQKKSIVQLIKSASTQGIKINGEDVYKVYKGTFQQEYSILSSDSAYFYPQKNAFDAFGHVRIKQGDTLNVYSDKLNYDGNTHTALLTDNVRLVDKDATLSTNYLTYNTATRTGTYTGGGKLVNKQNTLVSQNGYYYANTRDAYFRYNVVLTTNDAVINTDTLRYNSGSRIAYFLGPTNIIGKKDKDNLYTENGIYNTITEQASFGKKNLYTQGTKTLKGDSLFYDRLKGYGRAVKNITFNDEEQKITMRGDLGTYYKADEHTVVTKNAYVIIVTEEKDTTKTDSTVRPLTPTGKKSKPATVKNTPPPNTIPVKSIKATAKNQLPANVKDSLLNAVRTRVPVQIKDSLLANKQVKALAQAKPGLPANVKVPAPTNAQIKSVADEAKKLSLADTLKGKAITGKKPKTSTPTDTVKLAKAPAKTKLDSIYIGADTLETKIITYKAQKDLQEKMRKAGIKDTTFKNKATTAVPTKKKIQLSTAKNLIMPPSPSIIRTDTSYYHRDYFGLPRKQAVDTTQKKKATPPKVVKASSLKKQTLDSVYLTREINLSDTARVRILSAHHDVKIFKSDLQAVSDSMFYSNSDSIMRCYVHPMFWTQGSQLSGDTIHLQLQNKKLNNMNIFLSGFIVNIENNDSTHFNQLAGKRMRGYFVDNKLQRVFVDGNAESIYFNRDSGKVTDMVRSLGSRIRINFRDNKAVNLAVFTKPENKYGSLESFPEDDRILRGFIWKPKDRPVSKDAVIHRTRRKLSGEKEAPAKTPSHSSSPPAKGGTPPPALPTKGQPRLKPPPKDSVSTKPAVRDTIKAVKP
ncbi:hypothetical protein HH214_05530 [Mucilaginibacter robiniae]|uniref:Organic solvent tolerance-like N-terminal domain-containing protein n=1 Tax=Mucilaginibacter robiniae TaxID=2728022 RepID=A0A7L5DZD0_9SPHI|nr:OstA-like protein [Mucilaginibacter robiniae]QJD95369.1 hypothetical protein HH214_05530 [Mucilaginibacter robiniae]